VEFAIFEDIKKLKAYYRASSLGLFNKLRQGISLLFRSSHNASVHLYL
jgi:hypothetical protein